MYVFFRNAIHKSGDKFNSLQSRESLSVVDEKDRLLKLHFDFHSCFYEPSLIILDPAQIIQKQTIGLTGFSSSLDCCYAYQNLYALNFYMHLHLKVKSISAALLFIYAFNGNRYITLQTPPAVGRVPVQLHVGWAAERGQQDQHRPQQQLRRGRRPSLQQHQHQAQQPQGAAKP